MKSSDSDRKLDADTISNIAQDHLIKIGYTHHTIRGVRTDGHVWKILAEADKIELTLDANGRMLGYVLHKAS
jgi:hypothetical protein